MATEVQRYTAEEIMTAARDLQDAAGSPEAPIEVPDGRFYTLEQTIQLLSTEIRLLRERGFSSERIAELFTGFDIQANTADIEHFYARSEFSRSKVH